MDQNVCRETLSGMLVEEASLLAQLEDLLEREQDVLKSKDVAAINATALERQERIGALARLEEQRRALCSLHGQTPDLQGLDKVLGWCDPKGTLVPRLRECAERAARCRDLNDRNGTLVNARLKRVEGLLNVLTGRVNSVHTYGPKGACGPSRSSRVLGAA
jgi:flagella synthesis protein FlgN